MDMQIEHSASIVAPEVPITQTRTRSVKERVMINDRYIIDQIKPQESWRVFRVMAEFVDGIERLTPWNPRSPSSAQPGPSPAKSTTPRRKNWAVCWQRRVSR